MPDQIIDVPGVGEVAFPDSMSDQEITAAIQELTAPAAPAPRRRLPSATAFGGQREEIAAIPKPTREGAIQTLDLLPLVGGAGGAVLGGGWASVPLAGLGGAGGEAFRQLGRRALGASAPSTPGAAARSIAAQGAIQGGSQALGVGAGKAVPLVARRLYQSVAKPSKAVRTEFPTVVPDALEAGVPVGRSGAAKAGRLVDDASAAAEETKQAAEAAGAPPVQTRQVAGSLQRTRDLVNRRPIRAEELQRLDDIESQFLTENPSQIPFRRADDMRKGAQEVADEAYRQSERGASSTLQMNAMKDIAHGLRTSVEDAARMAGFPQLGAQNARTRQLIGVRNMADEAAERVSNNLPTGLGMQAGIAGASGLAAGGMTGDSSKGAAVALGSLALTNPALASRLAILMNRSGPLLTQMPQGARLAALLAELEGTGP